MNPEEMAALKDLIEFLQQKKIGEFRLERGELKVELKFEAAIVAAQTASQQLDPLLLARLLSAAPAMPAAAPAQLYEPAAPAHPQAPAPPPEEILHTVKSPIVGTFYEAPSPGAPPFARVGDQVTAGQPLCIVEAMKLMNEIESDVTGEIVKQLVQNGHPIEYGQPLYAVRAK